MEGKPKRSVPTWVSEAAALPVAFAQVREDPLLDAWVVGQAGAGCAALLIASGGCTAAFLAGGTAGRLHLVDPNPAQLALARLKLWLLQTSEPAERHALLGHAPLPSDVRSERLAEHWAALGLPADCAGPLAVCAAQGPDHAGRYEVVFAQLRERLRPHAAELEELMRLRNLPEQGRRVAAETALGRALDAAFDEVMALENLIALFGEGATRNRVEPFARHFARRTRHALATLPAADSPYLGQVLLGRYPDGAAAPWLSLPRADRLPEVSWQQAFVAEALRGADGDYDFVHLSNVLDWLSPEEAAATLALARQALRPGGWVLVRQLNSTLDVRCAGQGFAWDAAGSDELHRRDRSYFYRALHLGRKT
jgi:S-adenosylmethionine-diacylglycerol 3-amino-3-carboxypropyl transferase